MGINLGLQRHNIGSQGADTIAHKWQWNTCYWHNTGSHAHINQHMESQHGGNTYCQKSTKGILSLTGNLNSSPQYYQIQEKQNYSSYKAPLLTYYSKDKVCMILW